MTAPSLNSFFGGGSKSAKFPNIGDTVTGTILHVGEPENQTDYDTRQPIEGKFQIRIDLATDQRDPEDPYDDGTRSLYVKGWMQGAVGDALRKAGARKPEIGGVLTVTYTGDGQPSRAGMRGPKQYSASYTPATAQAQAQFFDNTAPAAAAPAAAPAAADTPPPGIDAAAWAAMPADAKAAVKNAMGAPAPF